MALPWTEGLCDLCGLRADARLLHLPELLQPAEALLWPCHGCTGRRWGHAEVKVWHKHKSADSSQIVWPQHQSWLSGARLPSICWFTRVFPTGRNNRTRDLREIIEEWGQSCCFFFHVYLWFRASLPDQQRLWSDRQWVLPEGKSEASAAARRWSLSFRSYISYNVGPSYKSYSIIFLNIPLQSCSVLPLVAVNMF